MFVVMYLFFVITLIIGNVFVFEITAFCLNVIPKQPPKSESLFSEITYKLIT